jgi:multisubunit Na+/H+ antiporter MnhG subunit
MAIGNEAGDSSELPYSESYLAEFERRFCYDRYCDARLGTRAAGTRFMSTGHTLVGIGEADDRFFMNADGGFLGRFRHQHFLLFLVAHFQRAALPMFSDRLVAAVSRLDIGDADATRVFRRDIRHALENFLRFEHRYWFYEIANQAQARELYAMTRQHLGLDALYRDIREELQDMDNFLDVEAMRRQNETVVRLTVVTTFGLIGTVCTGFLGMNLLAWAEHPTELRVLAFLLVLILTSAVTLYTVAKSRGLSEFMDALSDDQVSWRAKMKAFQNVWRKR